MVSPDAVFPSPVETFRADAVVEPPPTVAGVSPPTALPVSQPTQIPARTMPASARVNEDALRLESTWSQHLPTSGLPEEFGGDSIRLLPVANRQVRKRPRQG